MSGEYLIAIALLLAAYRYLVKFTCGKNRRLDLLFVATVLTVVSAVFIPCFLWFLPAGWLAVLLFRPDAGRSLFYAVSVSLLAAGAAFGFLCLIWPFDDAAAESSRIISAAVSIEILRPDFHPESYVELFALIGKVTLAVCFAAVAALLLFRSKYMLTDDRCRMNVTLIFALVASVQIFLFAPSGAASAVLATVCFAIIAVDHLSDGRRYRFLAAFIACPVIMSIAAILFRYVPFLASLPF